MDGKDGAVLYKTGDKYSRKYRKKILILKTGCSNVREIKKAAPSSSGSE
jgi:hypothetical protein